MDILGVTFDFFSFCNFKILFFRDYDVQLSSKPKKARNGKRKGSKRHSVRPSHRFTATTERKLDKESIPRKAKAKTLPAIRAEEGKDALADVDHKLMPCPRCLKKFSTTEKLSVHVLGRHLGNFLLRIHNFCLIDLK